MVVVAGLWPACDCGGNSGGDIDAGECGGPADCEALHGAPPCGAWECNASTCEVVCPGCTDADHDGYGVEAMPGACAGPDCDDTDDTALDAFVRQCYSGATGTAGVGVCVAGSETCVAGVIGPCTGEIVPTGEACNTEDDNCNAATDEGLGSFTCGIGACTTMANACSAGVVGTCLPTMPATLTDDCSNLGVDDDCDGPLDEDCNTACVRVTPTGNDAGAIATNNATPFATIQAAIDWSAADVNRPKTVCVAAGPNCPATATYAGPVTMSNGISVLGDYHSLTFARCATSNTVIQPGTATGVTFPATVTSTTVLDGFRIDRATMMTTAAVTVDGATGVILSDLQVSNTPTVTTSYAINLINGAQAQILRSDLLGGTGTAESIAIRSVGSTPVIRANCVSVDPATGRCDDFCGNPGQRAIRGRFTPGTGVAYGVYLENSPNAVVDTSAICGMDADTGAGIRVSGDATGLVVRGNVVFAWGGAIDSVGIWMEDCGGAAPWIVDNEYIAGAGDSVGTATDGIRAVGACHPVIDTNVMISGGGEGGTSGANGVHCAANINGASRCTVINNVRIQGSEFGFPPTAVGVRCDDNACERIAGNVIDGRGGLMAWGVYLNNSGTVIENNEIHGGCTTQSAMGVYSANSYARLHNNRIFGGACTGPGGAGGGLTFGIAADVTIGLNELDVHSNVIDGGTFAGTCTSVGLAVDLMGTAPTSGSGVYRNNIIRAGRCASSRVVEEKDAAVDPRVFQNNDLDPTTTPQALYYDEASTGLTLIADVNGRTDMTTGGNISADAMFINYPRDLHLNAGSACDNAGTPTGAPAVDMDGMPRDPATPTIGADEI